ncbi:MAG: hypothetical protein WCO63_11740 [Bacteroidota bacterium]
MIKIIRQSLLVLLVITCFFPLETKAQITDTSSAGWFIYGINMGFYFPDNKPAKFYDGSPQNSNNLNYIINNYYYRQQIEQELGYALDTTNPYTLPGNLKYKPTYSIGFYFKITNSKTSGWFMNFNYSKMVAKDIAFVNLDLPNTSFNPRYRECPIVAKESRYIMDIGYSKTFKLKKSKSGNSLFIEYGINLTNVKVISHEIQIGNTIYNMVNQYGNQGYIPGTTTQSGQLVQGGVGLGLFASGGVMLKFNEVISVNPGVTLYFHHINLGTWDALRPSANIFVRLIMPF